MGRFIARRLVQAIPTIFGIMVITFALTRLSPSDPVTIMLGNNPDITEEDRAELRGYVPIEGGLLDLYRESHMFLHVSFTEGLPQVLFEAFAAGLPTVATRVGGVSEAAGDSALLIGPDDAEAAAVELERLAGDEQLRRRLIESGLRRARDHTLDAECDRVLNFIDAALDAS